MIKAGDFRTGKIIIYNGQLHEVVEAQHYKPGKGGAFMKTKLRNINTGSMASETLRPEETFEDVFVETKNMQYLYKDDHGYCFMDEANYEQLHIPEEKLGDAMDYIVENMTVTASMYDGNILSIAPPINVILEVVETDPGFKGDTVSGATKPATLETGKEIRVPLFVERNTKIKVDTRTGEYMERA